MAAASADTGPRVTATALMTAERARQGRPQAEMDTDLSDGTPLPHVLSHRNAVGM
jgi:hypothetical protein